MSTRAHRTPTYRLHKPTGQAVVTLDGRDYYLGKFGSDASRAEYDRLIAEWLAHGRRLPATGSGLGTELPINEMSMSYLRHADSYYVKNGKPTTEPTDTRQSIRLLRQLYGHSLAKDFGPLGSGSV